MNGLENLISDIILNKGAKFGRKKIEVGNNFELTCNEWKNGKITAIKAMELLNLKSNISYRIVKEYESIKIEPVTLWRLNP